MENLTGVWDFVTKYYPKYYSSNFIALADDLQKILDGELNGNAERLFKEEFGEDLEAVQNEYNRVHREIYEDAIEAYLETLQPAKEVEDVDLFQHIETLPKEVQDVIEKHCEMDETYENCNKLVNELEAVCYTCEYGLDAIPYNLRKIEKK